VLLVALAGVALPLLALDRLWSFIYSQIPLKDGPERAAGFLAANLICLYFCAAITGSTARNLQSALAIAVAASGAAGFALWAGVGTAPAPYVVAALFGVPASSLIVFRWRVTR
jgi:hypothetical protein